MKIYLEAIIIVALLMVSSIYMNGYSDPSGFAIKETKFKVSTVAECNNKGGRIICEDVLYYTCGGKTTKSKGDVIKCEDIRFYTKSVKLKRYDFLPDWKDPRSVQSTGLPK